MFSQYDTFILKKELHDGSVPVGTLGVVLDTYNTPRDSYEVEFPDGDGGNLGNEITYTITEEYMRRGGTVDGGPTAE